MLKKERAALEEELQVTREADQTTNIALRKDMQTTISELTEKHSKQLNELREQLNIEKESWEDMYLRKQSMTLKSKESEMRDELRAERDSQINKIIQRLSTEAATLHAEGEKQVEIRIKRVKESFERQVKDLESSEQACLAKYNESRRNLAEVQEEVSSLQGTLKGRERDLTEMRAINDRLIAERSSVTDVVRHEFSEALAANELKIQTLEKNMDEARVQREREKVELEAEKSRELDNLHKRVQTVISKKDETISMLRSQLAASTRRQ